jgi:glycosyltransferase involved in cell wall biosynthesis
VALESLAAGTPVIASRVGGLSEIIRNEKVGLLVKPADPYELSKAIVKALRDMKFDKEEIMKTAVDYDYRNIAKITLNLYRRLA